MFAGLSASDGKYTSRFEQIILAWSGFVYRSRSPTRWSNCFLAQALGNFVRSCLCGSRNVRLQRLEIWFDYLECFSVSDSTQCFQETGCHTRRVLLFFEIRIKKVRTFKLRQIANCLFVPARV